LVEIINDLLLLVILNLLLLQPDVAVLDETHVVGELILFGFEL
jgi:hypothetical protein